MDGKGRAFDNIFIERFRRSMRYEHVYLNLAYDGPELFRELLEWFHFYNTESRHQSLFFSSNPSRQCEEEGFEEKNKQTKVNILS